MLRELSEVEQRYQAVLAVLEDGLSVTDAAAKVEPRRVQSASSVLTRRRVAPGLPVPNL